MTKPDAELTANTLAPNLHRSYDTLRVAAGVGLLRVFRSEAVEEMAEAFRSCTRRTVTTRTKRIAAQQGLPPGP